jgi:predicted phosphohydrolase
MGQRSEESSIVCKRWKEVRMTVNAGKVTVVVFTHVHDNDNTTSSTSRMRGIQNCDCISRCLLLVIDTR